VDQNPQNTTFVGTDVSRVFDARLIPRITLPPGPITSRILSCGFFVVQAMRFETLGPEKAPSTETIAYSIIFLMPVFVMNRIGGGSIGSYFATGSK